jgi:hypothetical protein
MGDKLTVWRIMRASYSCSNLEPSPSYENVTGLRNKAARHAIAQRRQESVQESQWVPYRKGQSIGSTGDF